MTTQNNTKYMLFETGSAKYVMIRDGKVMFTSDKTEATIFQEPMEDIVNRYPKQLKYLWDKEFLVWERNDITRG